MARKYVWLAVVFAVAVAATMAFTPAGERAATAASLGPVALLVAVLQVPGMRRFVLRHARGAIALGIGAFAIGALVLFQTLSSPSVDPGAGGSAVAVLILAGSMVTFLPFMARRAEKDVAVWKEAAAAARRVPGAFDPAAEVRAVLAELGRNRGPLFRVVGPWFLLFCALSAIFLDLDHWKALAVHDRGSAMMVLLAEVVVLLADLATLFVAMIQWTRFIATRQEPRLTAFPGKALWGWAWRWLIYGALFRFLDRFEPWLKAQLPAAPQWQIDGIQALLGLVALVFFSPYALVFTAVALDAADKGVASSLRGYRQVGRKFYLGAALILAPNAVAAWALGVLYDHDKAPAAVVLNVAASRVLLFATAIVATTYLTRIYLRGASAPAAGA